MSYLIPLLATSFFLAGPRPALGASYSLIESHTGSSFFDGWIYETGYDNTSEYSLVSASTSHRGLYPATEVEAGELSRCSSTRMRKLMDRGS